MYAELTLFCVSCDGPVCTSDVVRDNLGTGAKNGSGGAADDASQHITWRAVLRPVEHAAPYTSDM